MRTPGVLGPDEVLAKLGARLDKAHRYLSGAASWVPAVALGTSRFRSEATLRAAWDTVFADKLDWEEWERTAPPGVRVEWFVGRYRGSDHTIPARVVVDDLESAARLLGGNHPARLEELKQRWDRLSTEFGDVPELGRVLSEVRGWSDRDFDILCGAAAHFRTPLTTVLTSRQVPVPGMDTKWLRKRLPWVARLAGVRSEDLPVTTRRPGRVHFTYLDPGYVSGGGRKHDLATEGDRDVVAYRPTTVVICENRDAAQLFGDVHGGIAIEGEGTGPGLIASLAWVKGAARLWYWGDMDAKGLEILSGFRRAGLRVSSLLMDMPAYDRWEHLGVNHGADGASISWQRPRDVDLTDAERELYIALCAEDWPRHRRVEQERLDPTEAWSRVTSDEGYAPR